MAKENLYKTKKENDKIITRPKLPQHKSIIEIPHFGPLFTKFSKTVSYEVNLILQCSNLEVLL